MHMHSLRRPRMLVAVAGCALLASGCGGSGSPGVASVDSSATATRSGATTRLGTLTTAFAFARCMRAHGIPGWPDPNSQGFFDKTRLQALGVSGSRMRALEQGACDIPLPGPRSYALTAKDEADYHAAAACMRAHGFPGFPDPSFPNNTSVRTNIPSTIDQDAPAFRRAAATCTRLIPAGLPYSHHETS